MSLVSKSPHTHPLELQNAMPLDFNNMSKLPDSYAWTQSDDPLLMKPLNFNEHVPIIDLNVTPNDTLDLIKNACKEWGVFQVINHGIPISLLENVELETRRLFALPLEVKLRTIVNSDAVNGYAVPRISKFYSKKMWVEGFRMQGCPENEAKHLWEDQDDCKNFCDVMVNFQEETKKLINRLINMMLMSLGLADEDATWFEAILKGSMQPDCMLQLNSYPVCPDPDKAMGMAPHSDTSLLTLLYHGNIDGFHVFKENAGWVAVPPVKGAIIVNVGDLMHVVTNGIFKPVIHRAMVNKDAHRISYAYFFCSPKDVKVAPLMKLIDSDHPALYCPVTCKEYSLAKYKEFDESKGTYINKALEIIKNDV